MEHSVPQLLEEPTKPWKLIRITRRNVSVASCLTQVLDLQEHVLPLGEITKASLPRLTFQQRQRSTPHPLMSCTLQLPQGDSSSHCPPSSSLVAGQCCSAGGRGPCTISAAMQMHPKETGYSACHSDVQKVTKECSTH